MKYKFFIFIFFSHFILLSQEKKVNEVYIDIELADVLSDLEQKYSINTAFDPQLIANTKITIELKDVFIEEAMLIIFNQTPFKINHVRDNYFLVVPAKKKWVIAGRLIDENGAVIPYAKLWVLGSEVGGYSDFEGFFNFTYQNDVEPSIEVSRLGFYTLTISASELQKLGNDLTLEFDNIQAKEVLIEYLSEGITIGNDISHITLDPKKMGASSGNTEPDVFQMAQNIPGVNSANSSVSEIQIRGGSADQNHILWEGIEIYHPGHFYGLLSSINPNIIDKTELHRDIYDPYYGGKASGMIKLSSIDYVPKKVEFGTGINMLQGDAYIKVPIGKKLGIMFSARSSYLNLWPKSPTYLQYSKKVYQETDLLSTGEYSFESIEPGEEEEIDKSIQNLFDYSDINSKLIYNPSSKTSLAFSFLRSKNELNYLEEDVFEEYQAQYYISSSNNGMSFKVKHVWNTNLKSELVVANVKYTYDYDDLLFFGEDTVIDISKTNQVLSRSIKNNNRIVLNQYNSITFGYQFLYNDVSYEISDNNGYDSVSIGKSSESIEHAVNVNYKLKKGKFLSKIGFRTSRNSLLSKIFIEPRLYVQYKLNKFLTVKSSTGIQNQFISQINENDFYQSVLSDRIWILADKDAAVLQSNIANFGCFINVKTWQFELDIYAKKINNIVNFQGGEAAINTDLIRGIANAFGVDVLIKKKWNVYTTWMSYSYNKINYDFKELSDENFPASFSQPHILKWNNSVKIKQFEFATSFKLASGKPYTSAPILNTFYNTDIEDNDYFLTFQEINSRRLPLFHQLDLTVMYTVQTKKKWKWKIGLSCLNLYNKNNVMDRAYEVITSVDDNNELKFNLYSIDKYYLGITPNAMLRLEF